MNSGNHFGGLPWLSMPGIAVSEARPATLFSPCKVFQEGGEFGRVVDLALFATYDDLCARLAGMFHMDQVEVQRNLVYTDSQGHLLRVGAEPYSCFVQTARRLKILAPAASGQQSSGEGRP